MALGGTLRVDMLSTDVKLPEQLPSTQFSVTAVTLTGALLGASDWAHLADLPSLRSLNLGGSTNANVIGRNLTKLTALVSLTLGPGLTDAGLARVGALQELTSLDLSAVHLSDSGLAPLRQIRGLRRLGLADAALIGDEGLEQLSGLPLLTTLSLSGSQVTDAGLEKISQLALQTLELKEARITDAGAAALSKHASLTTLVLAETALTDAGLMQLANVPKLTKLDITKTRVTRAGLERFKAATGGKVSVTANP